MTHKCPTCWKPVIMSQGNKWRPFCSERCKLIDMGAWIDGHYCLPAEEGTIEFRDQNSPGVKH